MKRKLALLSAAMLLLCTACGQSAQAETESLSSETDVITETSSTPVFTEISVAQTAGITEITKHTKLSLQSSATTGDTTTGNTTGAGTREQTVTQQETLPEVLPPAETAGDPAPDDALSFAQEPDTTVPTELPSAELTEPVTTSSAVPAETTPATTTTPAITSTTAPQQTAPDTSALDKIVRQYKRGCAVLLESLDGTELYSYNKNKLFYGASLIKLPYVYYCCTQIEAGKAELTDTITYTSNYRQGGAGVVIKKSYGTKFTLAELMNYALRYSDNTAYYMLVSKFGTDGFNQMTRDWGYSQVQMTVQGRFPALTASFMRAAMRKMYEKRNSGSCWKNAWEGLVNSQRSYARDIIGSDVDIAVKYGSIPQQYHETILVDGDKPYILVILSGAVNYTPDTKFVKNVIANAKTVAEQYNSTH